VIPQETVEERRMVLQKAVKEFQKHKPVVYVDEKPSYLTTKRSKITNLRKKQGRDSFVVIATSKEIYGRRSIPSGGNRFFSSP
jgi:hypothetical protein